jgi:hypothetical protein
MARRVGRGRHHERAHRPAREIDRFQDPGGSQAQQAPAAEIDDPMDGRRQDGGRGLAFLVGGPVGVVIALVAVRLAVVDVRGRLRFAAVGEAETLRDGAFERLVGPGEPGVGDRRGPRRIGGEADLDQEQALVIPGQGGDDVGAVGKPMHGEGAVRERDGGRAPGLRQLGAVAREQEDGGDALDRDMDGEPRGAPGCEAEGCALRRRRQGDGEGHVRRKACVTSDGDDIHPHPVL